MLSRLFGKSHSEPIPQQIYGRLMAQAREPVLYRDYGVPDTVMGRFDMLALHVYLFARRLRNEESPVAVSLSQDVFDAFVADIERALRELGIGDTTVPKRKKAMIRSFYGQIEDFDGPLAENNHELLAERLKNRYLKESNDAGAKALSRYVFKISELMAATSFLQIIRGIVDLPKADTGQ